jgi:hypothetical protein
MNRPAMEKAKALNPAAAVVKTNVRLHIDLAGSFLRPTVLDGIEAITVSANPFNVTRGSAWDGS